jgi:catechol 2,3-dioxygenase-like lactoylglutathione lyase family enzyme
VSGFRVARHTERLDEVVAFYRDRLGLRERGRFHDHAGYDGVFLELPGGAGELEFTAGGGAGAPLPHPESRLVLSFDSAAERDALAARAGVDPVVPENPYWREHGIALADPDGFVVILAVRG